MLRLSQLMEIQMEVDYDYVRKHVTGKTFNLSELARKTGVSYSSLNRLCNEPDTKLSLPLSYVLQEFFRKVGE
tara:strand:- start:910 stop:1128 length:219 start_codon:yes stop_codon:yes gene_type:complete